jgi:hypothetical protein
MARISAFVLIFALIVAPIASFCGAQSSAAGKCPPFCPMMHAEEHATAEQTDEMECHHGESTKQDCVMKSGCTSTWDLGFASPLPPGVLCLPMVLRAGGANGMIHFSKTISSLAGFKFPLFQPPRA